MKNDYSLTHLGIVSALGVGPRITTQRLLAGDGSRLSPFTLRTTGDQAWVGRLHEDLPELPEHLSVYNCRNHRLAYMAWLQIAQDIDTLKERFGPHRIGVVLGSSTAGLDTTEAAYRTWLETGSLPNHYNYKRQHAMGSVAAVVAEAAGVTGPAYTHSTACTSGAKAMISARDLLASGFCDAVITGGVDTLCHMTLNGFAALGAVSPHPSLPMSRNRSGLNIGEGAALFIMTRDTQGPVTLVGAGESCDAHHMSAPHPEGRGAEACMRAALQDAQLAPDAIHYLNMHGTATPQNDAMESLAVQRVLGQVPCSSTKPMIGHCLGAAGALEAAFCWLAMQQPDRRLPPHLWDGETDPDLAPLNLTTTGQSIDAADAPLHFMSNSFAFGGNNCSLIFRLKAQEEALCSNP